MERSIIQLVGATLAAFKRIVKPADKAVSARKVNVVRTDRHASEVRRLNVGR